MSIAKTTWRLLMLTGLLVAGSAWSLAFWYSDNARQQIFHDAGKRMEGAAESYASHAALSLAVADETLLRLRELLLTENEAAFEKTARYISREDTVGGAINRVSFVGPDGKARRSYMNGEPVSLADVSQRDYFLALRNDPSDRIVVSEPIVGKASGVWIILFSRPIIRNGKFDGIVFVGLEAARWARLVKTTQEEGALITLLSPGNRIIARSLDAELATGKQLALPPSAQTDGLPFDFVSPIDGHTRLSAIREVPDWGMRIIAGVDHNKLQAAADELARVALIPALLLSVLLLAAAYVIRSATHRMRAAERQRTEEAARSRTVLEAMSGGVLLVDAESLVIFANDTAVTWLGEPCGRLFAEALEIAGMAMVTDDGNPFSVEDPLGYVCLQAGHELQGVWLVDSNRQHPGKWIALHARPLFSDDGRVEGAVLALDDRSAEHERMADAEMSRTILARMNDAVMVTDARANILMVNAAYLNQSGFSEKDLLGNTPSIVRSKRHDDAFWAAMWQTLTQHGKWSGKVWNLRQDGSEYCVWHTITAVFDFHGRIARYVSVSRDITKQQIHEADLWQKANFDPLTGLANRTRFDDRLAQSLVSATRHKHMFAVFYLDLDRFKPVNDTLGHAAGDELLRQVGQRLRATVRKEDTLARIGGDEFALIMPRIKSAAGTVRAAEKILAAVNLPYLLDTGTASIGISIGIAIFPEHGDTAEMLLTAADRALYTAKAEGRNTWRLAPPLASDLRPSLTPAGEV